MEGKRKPLIKILPKDARKHTHSSGLEPNDVPTAFNNCLFIEGVILQEPAEGFRGLLCINQQMSVFFGGGQERRVEI